MSGSEAIGMAAHGPEQKRQVIRQAIENELRMGTRHYAKDGGTPLDTLEEIIEAIYRDKEIVIDTSQRQKPFQSPHEVGHRRLLRWDI